MHLKLLDQVEDGDTEYGRTMMTLKMLPLLRTRVKPWRSLGEEPDLWVPRPDGGFDPRFLMGVIVLAACSLHNFRMLGLRYTRS